MEEVYSLSVPLVVDTNIGKNLGRGALTWKNLPDVWILTVGNDIINGVITDTNRESIARETEDPSGIPIKGMSSSG